jgi:tetratricopeptide (TPR) repeat protein
MTNASLAGSDIAAGEPFPSLEALRNAHEELLERADTVGADSANNLAAKNQIENFVRRAVATGTILDTPVDRRSAQRVIDYWIATSYTSATPADIENGASTVRPYSLQSARLAPFEAGSVDCIKQRGEQVYNTLTARDRDLARVILMRLVRFSERSGGCTAVPAKRETLLALGKLADTRKIVDKFIAAEVLKVTHTAEGDMLELQYEALARKWERFSQWIETRLKFREAALFWKQKGRNSGALVSAGLAREAETYGDLNELELEFLGSSKKRSYGFYTIASVVFGVLILGSSLFQELSGDLYAKYWVPMRVDAVTSEVKSSSSAEQKSDGIRWLARYDQPVDLPEGLLIGIDLHGIQFSSRRPPTFTGAKLERVNAGNAQFPRADFNRSKITQSQFDRANLEFAQFRQAVVKTTSFVEASLSGASFDGAALCGGVNLSRADFNLASFRNIKYDSPPIVANAAWWLASGWTRDQIEELSHQDRSGIREAPSFTEKMTSAERALQTSPHSNIPRAFALNTKAWTLAVHGVDLEVAENTAREAVTIAANAREAVTSAADDPGTRGNFEGGVEAGLRDTLAYVLMQKGDLRGASTNLERALEITDNPRYIAEFRFRYAIVQFTLGNEGAAIENLRKALSGEPKYTPSHELLHMKDKINGKFAIEMDRSSKATDKPAAGSVPPNPASLCADGPKS